MKEENKRKYIIHINNKLMKTICYIHLGGSIGATLIAISPSYVLERNPALLIGKPNFKSELLPIERSNNNIMKHDAYHEKIF